MLDVNQCCYVYLKKKKTFGWVYIYKYVIFQSNPPTLEHYSSFAECQGTPSPTPSPAGSVGSVGSQSSGYSSGELRASSTSSSMVQHTAPPPCGPFLALPLQIHAALQKEHTYFTSLVSSFDLWEQADDLVLKGKHNGKNILNYFILINFINLNQFSVI